MTGSEAALARVLRAVAAKPHPLFRSAPGIDPADLDALDPLDLGTACAAAWTVRAHDDPAFPHPAFDVLAQGEERPVRFTAAACLEAVGALVSWELAGIGADQQLSSRGPDLRRIARVLTCCDPWPDGLGDVVRPLVEALLPDHAQGHRALGLAALAGSGLLSRVAEAQCRHLEGSPFAVRDVQDAVTWPPRALLLGTTEHLAGFAAPAASARRVLEAALERVREVQSGAVPYQADRAFDGNEGPVLGTACRIALVRDEPWLPGLLEELLVGVTVAPTAAKSCPSQSAAVAIAHAIADHPTPEAVLALRAVNRAVRHAGISKKLARDLRAAERNLADRPEVAIRLPDAGGPPTKAQRTVAVRALEGWYTRDVSAPYARWVTDLAAHRALAPLAAVLVWQVEDGAGGWRDVLPVADGAAAVCLTGPTGDPVPPPAATAPVRLWHPARAEDDDRRAWRDRIVALRLAQPFRQVFREHYEVPEGLEHDGFAGHAVSLVPLLGLARSEGWETDSVDRALRRRIGPAWVELDVTGAALYPGAEGTATTGAVRMLAPCGAGRRPLPFADLPTVLVSEALRAVDLLVSVTAFAVDREIAPGDGLALLVERDGLGGTARARRAALERIVPPELGGLPIRFGARHLHVGPFAVHLATARVTRDGDPVEVELPKRPPLRAIRWLPYDETLLEQIVSTIELLVSRPCAG